MAPLVVAPLVSLLLGGGAFASTAQFVFGGLAALLVAAAFAGGDPTTSQYDGAVTAAVTAASIVLAVAATSTAAEVSRLMQVLASVSFSDRVTMTSQAAAEMGSITVRLADVPFALILVGVAIARGASRAGTTRVVSAALAAGAVFLWTGALVAADGRGQLENMLRTLQAERATDAPDPVGD